MIATYRISDGHAKRQLVLSSGTILLVLAGIGTNSWLNGALDEMHFVVLAVVVGIAAAVCWRNYKQSVAFAANHVLTLTSDAVVIRDGATERRFPIDAIELLKVRRPYFFFEASFSLKVVGTTPEEFYGYENIDALIADLGGRIPRERIQDARSQA